MGHRPRTDIIFGINSDNCEALIPYDEETYEPHFSAYDKWDSDSWMHFYEKKTEKPAEELDITLGQWGYLEDAAQFVGIKSTHFHCDWDQAGVIPLDLLNHNVEEMTQKLKDFCEVMGIEFSEPKWLVLSSYG